MILPIKQMILEFTGPMTVTSQNRDGKLTPKSNLNKGINPNNNASLHEAKTKATGIFKKPSNLAENIIRDTNKIQSKEYAKSQTGS